MEDPRKLSVAFGSFACVIEGFEDPFPLMHEVVRYFQRMASENPGFGRFDEIADFDELAALLLDEGVDVEIAPIAGGVHVRRFALLETGAAPEAEQDEAGPTAEMTEAAPDIDDALAADSAEDAPEAGGAEDAPEEEVADEFRQDDDAADQSAEAEATQDENAEAAADDAETDETVGGEQHGTDEAPASDAERGTAQETDKDAARPDEAPLRLVPSPPEAPPSRNAPLRLDNPAPADTGAAAPAPKRLLLGPDLVRPIEPEPRPPFIDRVMGTGSEPPAEKPAMADKAQAGPSAPADPGAESREEPRRGGLGGFFRRSTPAEPAPPTGTPTAEAPAPKPAAPVPLRAVETEPTPQAPAAEETPEPQSRGLRSLLRGRPSAPAAPATAGPEPEPEPKAAAPRAAMSEPRSGEGDSLHDRLHSSFGDLPEPVSPSAVRLEEIVAGEDDPTTIRGFARAAGAASLPEMMTAATGYLALVGGQPLVTRGQIMAAVQEIVGETPLSAEAKVKAFGKLMRSGDLVRLDDGQFMLTEERLTDLRGRTGV
ncbi:hypothetical protein HMH01_07335 [Halovulum dunhuangense]|uniref:Uncharacterized protein n=1 Tax=Halovulum dunhuangense TaxID=1505036 RepID=A0A849L1W6_9RHOB|nr:hypothetical protein [Halovulum dunhuangense]NNU80250.1 hypothetical protein [Halovulum dunhuangense]